MRLIPYINRLSRHFMGVIHPCDLFYTQISSYKICIHSFFLLLLFPFIFNPFIPFHFVPFDPPKHNISYQILAYNQLPVNQLNFSPKHKLDKFVNFIIVTMELRLFATLFHIIFWGGCICIALSCHWQQVDECGLYNIMNQSTN